MEKKYCDYCDTEMERSKVTVFGMDTQSVDFCSRKCFKKYFNLKEKWHDRIDYLSLTMGGVLGIFIVIIMSELILWGVI